MARKFNLYRRAGIREYWVIDPKSKTRLVHYFEGERILTRFYRAESAVPVEVLPGLDIDLGQILAE